MEGRRKFADENIDTILFSFYRQAILIAKERNVSHPIQVHSPCKDKSQK